MGYLAWLWRITSALLFSSVLLDILSVSCTLLSALYRKHVFKCSSELLHLHAGSYIEMVTQEIFTIAAINELFSASIHPPAEV